MASLGKTMSLQTGSLKSSLPITAVSTFSFYCFSSFLQFPESFATPPFKPFKPLPPPSLCESCQVFSSYLSSSAPYKSLECQASYPPLRVLKGLRNPTSNHLRLNKEQEAIWKQNKNFCPLSWVLETSRQLLDIYLVTVLKFTPQTLLGYISGKKKILKVSPTNSGKHVVLTCLICRKNNSDKNIKLR